MHPAANDPGQVGDPYGPPTFADRRGGPRIPAPSDESTAETPATDRVAQNKAEQPAARMPDAFPTRRHSRPPTSHRRSRARRRRTNRQPTTRGPRHTNREPTTSQPNVVLSSRIGRRSIPTPATPSTRVHRPKNPVSWIPRALPRVSGQGRVTRRRQEGATSRRTASRSPPRPAPPDPVPRPALPVNQKPVHASSP